MKVEIAALPTLQQHAWGQCMECEAHLRTLVDALRQSAGTGQLETLGKALARTFDAFHRHSELVGFELSHHRSSHAGRSRPGYFRQ